MTESMSPAHDALVAAARAVCDEAGREAERILWIHVYEDWRSYQQERARLLERELSAFLDAIREPCAATEDAKPPSSPDFEYTTVLSPPNANKLNHKQYRRVHGRFQPFLFRSRLIIFGVDDRPDPHQQLLVTLIIANAPGDLPIFPDDVGVPSFVSTSASEDGQEQQSLALSEFDRFEQQVYWDNVNAFKRLPLIRRDGTCRALARAIHAVHERIRRGEFEGPSRTHAAPAMCSGFTPKELAAKLNMNPTTLARYAESAGVTRPTSGERGFRFPIDDAVAISQEVANIAKTSKHREAARTLLRDMQGKPAKRPA